MSNRHYIIFIYFFAFFMFVYCKESLKNNDKNSILKNKEMYVLGGLALLSIASIKSMKRFGIEIPKNNIALFAAPIASTFGLFALLNKNQELSTIYKYLFPSVLAASSLGLCLIAKDNSDGLVAENYNELILAQLSLYSLLTLLLFPLAQNKENQETKKAEESSNSVFVLKESNQLMGDLNQQLSNTVSLQSSEEEDNKGVSPASGFSVQTTGNIIPCLSKDDITSGQNGVNFEQKINTPEEVFNKEQKTEREAGGCPNFNNLFSFNDLEVKIYHINKKEGRDDETGGLGEDNPTELNVKNINNNLSGISYYKESKKDLNLNTKRVENVTSRKEGSFLGVYGFPVSGISSQYSIEEELSTEKKEEIIPIICGSKETANIEELKLNEEVLLEEDGFSDKEIKLITQSLQDSCAMNSNYNLYQNMYIFLYALIQEKNIDDILQEPGFLDQLKKINLCKDLLDFCEDSQIDKNQLLNYFGIVFS